MSALDRVVHIEGELFGDLDIFLAPYIGKVAVYESIKVIRQEFIEYLEVFMEICGDVKPMKKERSPE